MKEINKNLYIGNQLDYETTVKKQEGWTVVHACKEPYHRNLLCYTGRGAPKTHPEYYFAEREDRLYLNLVDAPNSLYIPEIIIDKAIDFVITKLEENKQVLVHCNQGMSRSAIIGLLILAKKGNYKGLSFEEAEKEYIKIYPQYKPASGVRGYARSNWDKYCK